MAIIVIKCEQNVGGKSLNNLTNKKSKTKNENILVGQKSNISMSLIGMYEVYVCVWGVCVIEN